MTENKNSKRNLILARRIPKKEPFLPASDDSDLVEIVFDQIKDKVRKSLLEIATPIIHNLVTLSVLHYNPETKEFNVTLETEDSSYDLASFYHELSKHRYALK